MRPHLAFPEVNGQRQWDVDALIALADCITVPTAQMADDVLTQWPACSVVDIPDRIISLSSGCAESAVPTQHTPLRIGWFGTSLNMEHIPLVADALSRLHQQQALVLRLITRPHQGMVSVVPDVPCEYIPWTLAGHEDAMRECDMMVLPMMDRPNTRTKSSNRLQLCLALGIPVIASPLASYRNFVQGNEHLVTFATTSDEWFAAMVNLSDLPLRQQLSMAG